MYKHLIRMIITFIVLYYFFTDLNQLFFDNPYIRISYAIFFPIIFAITRLKEKYAGFLRGIFTGFKVFIPGMFLMTLPFGIHYFHLLFFLVTLWDDYRFNKPAKRSKYSDMDHDDWSEYKERQKYDYDIQDAERELEYAINTGHQSEILAAEMDLRDKEWELSDYEQNKWDKRRERNNELEDEW